MGTQDYTDSPEWVNSYERAEAFSGSRRRSWSSRMTKRSSGSSACSPPTRRIAMSGGAGLFSAPEEEIATVQPRRMPGRPAEGSRSKRRGKATASAARYELGGG